MPKAALRHTALVAGYALICLFYASLWFCLASSGAAVIGCRAWGKDSSVASAASTISLHVFLMLVLPLIPIVLVLCILRPLFPQNSDADEVKDVEAPTAQDRVLQFVIWKMLKDPIILGCLACMPFAFLMLAGFKVGSSSSVGSILLDVGFLGAIAITCFIILPCSVLRLWRMQ